MQLFIPMPLFLAFHTSIISNLFQKNELMQHNLSIHTEGRQIVESYTKNDYICCVRTIHTSKIDDYFQYAKFGRYLANLSRLCTNHDESNICLKRGVSSNVIYICHSKFILLCKSP